MRGQTEEHHAAAAEALPQPGRAHHEYTRQHRHPVMTHHAASTVAEAQGHLMDGGQGGVRRRRAIVPAAAAQPACLRSDRLVSMNLHICVVSLFDLTEMSE